MKKILLLITSLMLFSSFTDNNLPRKGDSILKDAVKVCDYVPYHCLIYYYKGFDLKFGFVQARNLDFEIVLEPQFDDVYEFGTCDGSNGCLMWVKKNGKWGVLDIDYYEMKTEFIYSRISEFTEKNINPDTHKGVYEAEAELDGKIVTVSIEKYLCIMYYDY